MTLIVVRDFQKLAWINLSTIGPELSHLSNKLQITEQLSEALIKYPVGIKFKSKWCSIE